MIASMRMTYVALMRGINVGGKNKLPMATLAKLFADEKCAHVTTFIQSGNVIFDAPAKAAATVAARISRRIGGELGLEVPVVVRSAAELAAVPARNPFARADIDQMHIMFLADEPAAARARVLDAARSPGDEFALVGRDVYLRLPNGVGRSKLTNAYFDKTLATVSTIRNWRTLLKLIGLSTR
jgi:uncharacterized protein (DUF1697 family)